MFGGPSTDGDTLTGTSGVGTRRRRGLGAETGAEGEADGLSTGAATWSSIAASSELPPTPMTDSEIASLVTFLEALTDPDSRDLSGDIPERVASGLPLID